MIRSKQLGLGAATGLGNVDVYTCPAGVVALIKWFSFNNQSAGAQSAGLYVRASSGSARLFYLYNDTLPVNETLGGTTWFVLEEGNVLGVRAGDVGHYMAGGAELGA